jgi:hypothetical protein
VNGIRFTIRPSRLGVVAVIAACVVNPGCLTSRVVAELDRESIREARDELSKPLPGDLGALYRLRVASSGGLRLSLLTLGQSGRMTISEPFGSAISLTSWGGGGEPVFHDLREGCRLAAADLSAVLGVGALPLPQATRLLGGRLPALGEDRIEPANGGRLAVIGDWGSGLVTLVPDPWRIALVEQQPAPGNTGWSVRLEDHTLSVPGWIRVEGADGRWAELELVRLEWDRVEELPVLPDLPPCTGDRRGGL